MRQLLLTSPAQVRLSERVPDCTVASDRYAGGAGRRRGRRVTGQYAGIQSTPGEGPPGRHARRRLVRVQVRRGPPGEPGLATVMTVRRGTEHDRTPIGPVRSKRTEGGRFRTEPGPTADVRVPFPQDSAGTGCTAGTGAARGRIVGTILARVLLVPVRDVQSLEGGLHSQLMFAQVRSGFVRFLELILRGQNISMIFFIQ